MRTLTTEIAGKVSKLNADYDVFIPRKVSEEEISLRIDNTLLGLLSEAGAALGELNGISELLPNADLFIATYVQKEALLSSQIEGTVCSLDEVIKADDIKDGIKPVYEVMNYIEAMHLGLSKLQNSSLTLDILHEIHKELLKGVRGENKYPGNYKIIQNHIGPPGSKLTEATYVPPPPEMIQDLMEDLEKYFHAEGLPPLIKAAIIHAQFETIHPYLDGNGRLGRLLITFYLCEKKIISKPLLYLSLFFKEHKAQYYDLLMDVRFDGKWEEWIHFFLRGIRNTSQEAVKTAREILALQQKDIKKIKETLPQYKLALPCYEYLCKKAIVSISEIAREIKASYPAVKHTITELINAGILEAYNESQRNKLFYYPEYLKILKRGT
jgi:Fic family protein